MIFQSIGSIVISIFVGFVVLVVIRKFKFMKNTNNSTKAIANSTTRNAHHGFLGNPNWKIPNLAAKSDAVNRADHGNFINASEYLDDSNILEEKVDLVISLLKKAKFCTVYAGAGLSRASGLRDYASASNSINSQIKRLKSPYYAQPSMGHKVIAALERKGLVHHFVQQNHDGLPQKAGFPQEKMNEIHGAWFDPSNPVIKFDESLRTDFFEWMLDVEDKSDLCLCLGTSLSGMNADRIPKTIAKKSLNKNSETLGTVIINLQQTKMDDLSCVRVWSKLEDFFSIIAEKLNLDLDFTPELPPSDCDDKFIIPYNKDGIYDLNSRMVWNLQDGSKIIIQNPKATNANKIGEIVRKDPQNDYVVFVERKQYRLGKWWVKCVLDGRWRDFPLPFVNVEPEFV